jgi:hypothetical protein
MYVKKNHFSHNSYISEFTMPSLLL